jgi:hypothetical protein
MEWYYAKNNRQEGPVSGATLKSMIVSGEIASADLVWREGMTDWRPAAEINDFESAGVVEPAGIVAPPGGSQIPQALPPGVPGGQVPPAAPPNNSSAIVSMICGIVGLFAPCLCGFPVFASIVAIIMGHVARGEIRKAGGMQGGDGMALAGLILGYVGIGLFVGGIAFALLMEAS